MARICARVSIRNIRDSSPLSLWVHKKPGFSLEATKPEASLMGDLARTPLDTAEPNCEKPTEKEQKKTQPVRNRARKKELDLSLCFVLCLALCLIFLQNMLFGCEVPLRFQCGHTACTGSRDRLPVYVVLHIPTGKHAGNIGLGAVRFGDQVTIFIHIQEILEQFGIGLMTDSYKETSHFQSLFFVGLVVIYPHTGHILSVSDNFFGFGIVMDLNIRGIQDPVLHGF